MKTLFKSCVVCAVILCTIMSCGCIDERRVVTCPTKFYVVASEVVNEKYSQFTVKTYDDDLQFISGSFTIYAERNTYTCGDTLLLIKK